jgi:hypothetical protein
MLRRMGAVEKDTVRTFSWHFAVCRRDPQPHFLHSGEPLGLARAPHRARLQFVVANAARERTDGALAESVTADFCVTRFLLKPGRTEISPISLPVPTAESLYRQVQALSHPARCSLQCSGYNYNSASLRWLSSVGF